MLANSTTKSWLFPPKTREVQLDEKWPFVHKKQEHCDPENPADANRGDCWDHVAIDAESRLVLAVVPGARDAERVEELSDEVKDRTGGEVPRLVTSDEYPAYETAFLNAYGEEVETTRTGQPTRKMVAEKVAPAGINYATVEKRREKGRVVEILTRVVFGTMGAIQAVLAESKASRRIDTSFVERQNATDRHHDGREVRKTYTFSKDWAVHEAMTYFTMYSYDYCRAVRTLREPIGEGRWRSRTPAMAAGLADHVWTMHDWITIPGIQRN